MGRRSGLRKIKYLLTPWLVTACTLVAAACANDGLKSEAEMYRSDDVAESFADSSESSYAESSLQGSADENAAEGSLASHDTELSKPSFSIEALSQSKAVLRVSDISENSEAVSVYKLTASSENAGVVTRELIFKAAADDISDGVIEVPLGDIIESDEYEKNDSAVRCPYFAQGIQISVENSDNKKCSEVVPVEVTLDTGTVDQYKADLAGGTACGAAAGTLVIQSIALVRGDELTARMNTIRSYSAISDEYSIGGAEYYMSGQQISNSVNTYISDNGLGSNSLCDHRSESSTEDTLRELISTGRPAVLEVCYIGGNIITDYEGYSHWITVNGFRLTENGAEFRCEDTISLKQRWIASESLDTANKNVKYGGGFEPTRYISSLQNAVTESFF